MLVASFKTSRQCGAGIGVKTKGSPAAAFAAAITLLTLVRSCTTAWWKRRARREDAADMNGCVWPETQRRAPTARR